MKKIKLLIFISAIMILSASSASAFLTAGGILKCTTCHTNWHSWTSWHSKHVSRADNNCSRCHFLTPPMPVPTAACGDCHGTSKWFGKHDSNLKNLCNTCHDSLNCFARSALGDNDSRTNTLRQFRDEVLTESASGQYIIKTYYKVAPSLSRAVNKSPLFKKVSIKMIDIFIPLIELILEDKE